MHSTILYYVIFHFSYCAVLYLTISPLPLLPSTNRSSYLFFYSVLIYPILFPTFNSNSYSNQDTSFPFPSHPIRYCPILSYLLLSLPILLYSTPSYLVPSLPILFHHIKPYPPSSYLLLSYPILSYFSLSFSMISNQILSCPSPHLDLSTQSYLISEIGRAHV